MCFLNQQGVSGCDFRDKVFSAVLDFNEQSLFANPHWVDPSKTYIFKIIFKAV